MKKLFCLILVFSLLTINISYASSIYYKDVKNSELQILLNKIDKNYDNPDVSSEVTNLPWRNDSKFLYSKEKYNTPILMAAYVAVLKNPLPGEEANVKHAASMVKEKVIKPGDVFSQNKTIGPYTKERGFKEGSSYSAGKIVMSEGGGVCKIATTLYNLAVLSNLEIVERYNHSMPINYVPYGQDATVFYGSKDFRFKNTTDGNILIWSELIGNKLYMGFYGTKNPPKVTWDHIITERREPGKKYIKNESLKKGEMIEKIKGLEGATVKSTITIEYLNGDISVKNMGISRYNALPFIIETN
ncbi:VanW family protein [Tissierella creatinophila]|uniref:Vancomycin B-type resistance protein VanW n=1 Tax=Tissierella creatinophila DSM 6911 TaxID=1123403 RepID=A0A1U7M702_TISCR|nr:VanW family protein [Tissierella creatinophila]OLS03092.1 vancomycin B-type resistance protein VanW [Tissierella creatinophila DSM 6911]